MAEIRKKVRQNLSCAVDFNRYFSPSGFLKVNMAIIQAKTNSTT